MGKIRTTVAVFELPRRLGILQYVEYESPRREWCTEDRCLYEGILTVDGCKKGMCVRYRVWVFSKDGKQWKAGERLRKRKNEEGDSCLRQQIADALWELAERNFAVEVNDKCGIIINGVAVSRPNCRSVEECVRQMLEEYKKRLESPPPPPRREPEEEKYQHLIQQYPWLKWWNKDLVITELKRGMSALLDVLQRLNTPEIPHFVTTFIGRFELDIRCVVTVYRDADSYCVSFCIKDARPTTYCYEPDLGWRYVQQPKFVKLRPLEDGRLAEVYVVEGKELIRVA